jgi:integrase
MPPSRIRKIKKILPPPCAWSQADLQALLKECSKQRGQLRGKGISRAAYWRMFFLVAYSTGLRLGDLERLPSSMIVGPGSYRITQHKSKKPIDITIDQQTWEAIAATNPAKRKFVIRVMSRPSFFDALKIIVGNCELRGGTKMIRKAAGSLFERDNPGEGHKLLGNGRDVFLQYYADPKITDTPGRLPPRLSG